MVVSSPLELYTVYLGWRQYDVIWEACSEFGLCWLPFIGLIFENMTVPFETPFGHGAETSLRRMLIQLFLMGLFLLLFAIPSNSLRASNVRYKPYCADKAQLSTVGDTGTTYDNVFQTMSITDVKVPVMFGLAMDWSSGFTNALIRGSIPCKTDVKQLMNTLILSRVSSPIQKQVARFNRECYLRAKAKFDAKQPDVSSYESTMEDYGGEADLAWMGSHVLRELYYDQDDMIAQSPVLGFSYNSNRLKSVDEAVTANEMDRPEWGYPTCEKWWSDSQHGLEKAIVNDVDAEQPANNHLGKLKPSEQAERWIAALPAGNKITADDVVVRSVLYHSKGNYGGFSSDSAQVDTNPGMSGVVGQVLIGVSQTMNRFFVTPVKREAIGDILPIIRACALFFVIMFSPLVLIFGGYRFGVGIALCCALFILIFLDFIWAMNKYLENALLASMSDPALGNVLVQHPIIVNIMSDFYFVSASILLFILGWAGIKVGAGLDQMLSQSKQASDDINAGVQSDIGKASSIIFKKH